ncbi:hypothetical protein [Neomoorella mulderi]|uniref:Uncharacterized protein n=1 Tax=Moorella mulderi DSM 14980 TaxID=1122241 RepID=A0A151AV15_9FIRM|nr:hypothetical protein [Moorella mulderi]KYH31495.1 hypothetical protein MOMUL_22340 [Moorella mulderi DSM 14980]
MFGTMQRDRCLSRVGLGFGVGLIIFFTLAFLAVTIFKPQFSPAGCVAVTFVGLMIPAAVIVLMLVLEYWGNRTRNDGLQHEDCEK